MEETQNNTTEQTLSIQTDGDQAQAAVEPVKELPQFAPPALTHPPRPLPQQPITAGPGQYYRNTRYIMAALTIVMGFWFGYDGFVRWPAEHVKVEQLKQELAEHDDPALRDELKSHTDHSATDIQLQRLLAFSLPPLGICLLLWALYNSRGEYRLADDTLWIPGHPAVPLAAIKELDESTWDRKGIARVSYELADGRRGKAKLDDFVYDRTPTDQIYECIKAHLQPPVEVATAEDPTKGEVIEVPVRKEIDGTI